jgi:hypothetical protein
MKFSKGSSGMSCDLSQIQVEIGQMRNLLSFLANSSS